MNPTLRTMFQKARDASVPIDTIERAIKRGTGDLEGVIYESITYEGYAPGGVAVLVDVLTDNRNRSGSEIRNLFSKNGGSMAEPGAVAWQFERKGIVLADRSATEDDVMLVALDAGAEDITDDGDAWRITTPATELHAVRTSLEGAGIAVSSSELTMLPTATIALDTPEAAKKVLNLIDILDDNDDVQDVYANFDIPDAILEGIS
jgi:YebC/PmpR family DNA-binding regulatory protein